MKTFDTFSEAWVLIVPPFTDRRVPLIDTCVTSGTTFVTPKENPWEFHDDTISPSSQYSAVRTMMS